VKDPRDRIKATKLAWKATGVREVINELQITDHSSLTDTAKDILINKTLEARLLVDEKVKFINYTIDTVNGTVYLFGIAQNREELERVIAVARQINYVENIINYVTLK
jgi:osmotically-inducible protein OsmY